MLIYLVLPVVKHFRSFDEACQDGLGRYFGERPDPVFQRPVDNNNRSLSTTSGGCNTGNQIAFHFKQDRMGKLVSYQKVWCSKSVRCIDWLCSLCILLVHLYPL